MKPFMTKSIMSEREEASDDESNNIQAKSTMEAPPPTPMVTTGMPVLFIPEPIKRTDTDTTDQDSCAASTRAVWHFNTTTSTASTISTPSLKRPKILLMVETKIRPPFRSRFAILGVSVALLCAVITGVAITILVPRNTSNTTSHDDGNHDTNSSNVGNDKNETIDTTTNTTNTTHTNTTNDIMTNETNVFPNKTDISPCANNQETANAAWNAIASFQPANDVTLLGPMVGHVTTTTAKIWAFYQSNTTTPFAQSILVQRLGDCPAPNVEIVHFRNKTTTVELTNLLPNAPFRFQILLNGKKAGNMGTFTTVAATNVTKFRYMFGSCISFKRDANQTIWNDVLQQEPAFIVLNGDTVYSDTMNYTRHVEFHAIQRQIPTFANMIRQVPIYACWDDHDYGPNDSDGTDSRKNESLQAFVDLFPNPSFGTSTHPGIYTSFYHGNFVQFFLMDNRYHRMQETTYAGPEQMQWLLQQLERSTAKFKIIIHGGTIRRAGRQSWFERSKQERRELLDFIALKNITGVVFHGGDIHKNLLNTHPKCPSNQTLDYEVYELVSSGLTNRGGCYTIVDIDANKSTLTYSMIQAGQEEERGRLTILTTDGGVMSHELLFRSQLMALELEDCQQNLTRTTLAYPVIGGFVD